MSQDFDFSMVIASAVHDMKNSLGMMLHSLEELREEWTESSDSDRFSVLQYEAQRVHGDLVQLLGLYHLQQKTLSVHTEEYFLPDFLDEQLARHEPLLAGRGIAADFQAEDVAGYFDHDLVAGVLNNTLNNAIRYTHKRIRLTGRAEDGYTVLSVEDDGRGYPQQMLDAPETIETKIDFSTGSTSLGLYFAARVARMHTEGDREGRIKMRNGGELGGGIFEIWLP
ncbi:HAMP domain-containing sensor histidine kinase [Marinobacteraceae bacterium S3BR75-40.1]